MVRLVLCISNSKESEIFNLHMLIFLRMFYVSVMRAFSVGAKISLLICLILSYTLFKISNVIRCWINIYDKRCIFATLNPFYFFNFNWMPSKILWMISQLFDRTILQFLTLQYGSSDPRGFPLFYLVVAIFSFFNHREFGMVQWKFFFSWLKAK